MSEKPETAYERVESIKDDVEAKRATLEKLEEEVRETEEKFIAIGSPKNTVYEEVVTSARARLEACKADFKNSLN